MQNPGTAYLCEMITDVTRVLSCYSCVMKAPVRDIDTVYLCASCYLNLAFI